MEILVLFGAKIINTKNIYQLYRHQLNEALMKQWAENGYLDRGALRLIIDEYVPENLYGGFAALITRLMNDIMREDSQELFTETGDGIKQKMEHLKKSGIKMITFMLFDLENRMNGISFVQIAPNAVTAKQYMTGVEREYRGKKLAKYLKAMVTAEVFRRFPEIEKIETDCYDANKPMIRINESIGYALKGKSFQFSVEIEKVQKFLVAG